MDLSAMTALDVAIGLFFLFFLLSIVCSTVNELIASAFGWRARNLELAIRQLIADPDREKAFWDHPRIRTLGHPVKRRFFHRWTEAGPGKPTGAEGIAAGAPVDETPPPAVRKPSYLPARAFALTALDTLAPELADTARRSDSKDAVEQLRALASRIPHDGLRTAVDDALDEGRTRLDELRASIEAYFDATMDRASGWYKRRAQLALLCIATALTVGANVDTVQVASKLWKDDAVRGYVVQQSAVADPGPAGPAQLETLADNVNRVGELGLPLGWSEAGTPESVWGWLGKVLIGWPLTIVALSMGSAFWFDVLGRIARIRVAGKAHGTVLDDTGRKQESRA